MASRRAAPGGTLGVILAGGAARRMGQDKSRLQHRTATTMLAHAVATLTPVCDTVWVAVAPGQTHVAAYPDVPCVGDPEPHAGPLAALAALAPPAATGRLAILAVDMPNVTTPLFARMLTLARHRGAWAVVPARGGQLQPLAAVYDAAAPQTFAALLAGGERSIRRALQSLAGRVLAAGPDDLGIDAAAWDTVFADIDTPADYEAWRKTTST